MGTLTIRTTQEQDQIIEEVQNQLGELTASKTLLRCVMEYQDLLAKLEVATAKLEDSTSRVNELETLIASYVNNEQALKSAVSHFTSVRYCIDAPKKEQNLSRTEAKQAIAQIRQSLAKN